MGAGEPWKGPELGTARGRLGAWKRLLWESLLREPNVQRHWGREWRGVAGKLEVKGQMECR